MVMRLATAAVILVVLAVIFYPPFRAAASRQQLPGQACYGSSGRAFLAASQTELRAVLLCIPTNATVMLKSGNFGRQTVKDVKGLTLASDNPAEPASFESLTIERGEHVKLSHLRFGGNGTGLAFRLQILRSKDVKASYLRFTGTPGRIDEALAAISVRFSDQVTLKRSEISWARAGILFEDVNDLVIAENIIRDFRTDGMVGGFVTRLVVRGNYIANANPEPGDHPDAIQLFTIRSKTSSSDIRISDNLIYRGTGSLMQGIFITDNTRVLPYGNLEVANNLIVGSMYNGILLMGAPDARVRENTVVPLAGHRNWIKLLESSTVVMEGNIAQDFLWDQAILKAGTGLGKNRRLIVSEKDALAAITAWKAKHFPEGTNDGR